MYDVRFGGEDFQLVLRVAGYKHPDVESGYDADWLAAEAEMTVHRRGSFLARHAVSLRTDDLQAFRDRLAQLLENGEGVATISGLGEFTCTVTLSEARAELAASLGEVFPSAELGVLRVRTDRSRLQATVGGLENLLAALPVRRAVEHYDMRRSDDEELRRLDRHVLDLRRVQEQLHERWGSDTELTPNELVRKWVAIVAIVEAGYDGMWEEYTHDLMTREFIAELSRRLPEYWAGRFAEWIGPWDERFREATVEESEPHLLRDEEPGWWWYRSPRVWPGRDGLT